MPRHQPRVLLGMAETAGYLANLQRGFEEIGCTCHFVDLTEHPFEYRRSVALARTARWRAVCSRRAASLPRRSWRRLGWRAAATLLDLSILAWAIGHADLFVFTGHDSLLWRNADLPLLRLLGKRIVWVFLGSDHRPPYLNGKRVREARAAGDAGHLRMAGQARAFRTIVRRIERRAHVVVAMSASAQFHLRPFVHLLAIGLPHGSAAEPLEAAGVTTAPSDELRILHSPSDPAKGSDAIRACISDLQDAGVKIDYREITGRPHDEVLDAIEESGMVVDQLYSDSPLAVFATEAGYRGRAAVVGGYYADVMRDDVRAELIPPSHFVPPGQLCAEIGNLARDEAARLAIGSELAAFIRERWSRADVARRYLEIAFGPAPTDWLYDPARIRYLHGWGLAESELRDYLGALVSRCGSEALAMDHHPALQERLLAFAAPAPAEA
jgi:hypothetical protein